MRVLFGIILLVVCIVFVGMVAAHWFLSTPQLLPMWEPGFGPRAVVSPVDVHRSVFSLFALGGFSLLILVLGGLGLVLLLTGRGSKSAKSLNGEEARIVQQIYEGLSRMEKRVETLETILLEKPRDNVRSSDAFESME